MKKTLLTVAAVMSAAMFSANAHAVDSTGCGLGSLAWRGQKGPIPQILAVTTNGTFGNQTFGISSGTSGCDPQGRISGGTGSMDLVFLENNMEQFAMDASAGHGETIDTLAGILSVDSKRLGEVSKQNFATLFPSENVDAVDVTVNLLALI